MTTQEHSQSELNQARINIRALEVEVAHLTVGMSDLKTSISDLTKSMAAMNKTLSEASGGWKTLLLVGGAGAAITPFVSWILHATGVIK